MAKKKAEKKETKSDFLRRILGKNPDLDYDQVLRRWAKAGHPGTISNPLYYLVRRELGIKTVWGWVKEPDPGTPGGRPAKAAEMTGGVYQVKITLLGIKPPIWRRIQVGDCTLDALHEFIQTSMGWTNSHMHHFRIGEQLYGDPMLMGPDMEEMKYIDSTTTKLSQVVPQKAKGFRIEYEYDFGDGWVHDVLFEGVQEPEPRKSYPLCVDGARACPPDDCGGVWGYMDFLEAITDPEHENHKEMRRWIGRKFDPEAFGAEAATRSMRRGLPDWRHMR